MPWTVDSRLRYLAQAKPEKIARDRETRRIAKVRGAANRRARGEWSKAVESRTSVEVPFPVRIKGH